MSKENIIYHSPIIHIIVNKIANYRYSIDFVYLLVHLLLLYYYNLLCRRGVEFAMGGCDFFNFS
jgi:hypothetical protein